MTRRVVKSAMKRASASVVYGVIAVAMMPFFEKANAIAEEANSRIRSNSYSSEAAAPDMPTSNARNNVARSTVQASNNTRPRYGRINSTSPVVSNETANSVQSSTPRIRNTRATQINDVDNSAEDPQIRRVSNSRAQYTAAEVEMRNLGIEDNAIHQELTPVSDVRPEDIAPWQKIGAPYQVNGIWYIPAHEPDYDETGTASWYGSGFNGKPTANNEIFDENIVSVAHPTLPIPSLVEITNLENGRSIIARVNDRGPFVDNRLVDVSARGAELLGFKDSGTANVRVRYIGQAPRAANVAPPTQTAQNLQINNINTRLSSQNTRQMANNQPRPNNNQANNIPANGTVQLGAFASRANAENISRQYNAMGTTRISEVQVNGNTLYRVILVRNNIS